MSSEECGLAFVPFLMGFSVLAFVLGFAVQVNVYFVRMGASWVGPKHQTAHICVSPVADEESSSDLQSVLWLKKK